MRGRRIEEEGGAFIVIWALLLVGVMGMVAIVLDLSALRQDRRANRSVTDAAATAAAFSLGNETPLETCDQAWTFVARNLGFDPISGVGASPCALGSPSPFGRTACTGATAGEVQKTVGAYTITIKSPVPNNDPIFMRASSAGGDKVQAYFAPTDGTDPCRRVGVRVQQDRTPTFGRVFDPTPKRTESHSVALYVSTKGPGADAPALIALNMTDCLTINANTGLIQATNNGTKAAIMRADSNGSECLGSNYVLMTQSGNGQGKIEALPGTGGELGELGFFAPPSAAFRPPGDPAKYVGELLALTERTTRNPVDEVYSCTRSKDGCEPGQVDYYDTVLAPLAHDPRPAFQQFAGQLCSSPPSSFAPGNWYVDCPIFEVGNPVSFEGSGTIIFTGKVAIKAKGILKINTASVLPGGLPKAKTDNDTVVVIRDSSADALSLQAAGAQVSMARTLLFNSGGLDLQGGPTVRWSAPEFGGGKDVLSWNESGELHRIQGTPVFRTDGIFFAPNSKLEVSANGRLDATNVQVWFDRFETQGNGKLLLRPNSNRAITIFPDRSQLIR